MNALYELDILYNAVKLALGEAGPVDGVDENLASEAFLQALEDDLNTPEALGELFQLAGKIRGETDPPKRRRLGDVLVASGKLMGLLQSNPKNWFNKDVGAEIKDLIEERDRARKQKDYAKADKIRDELAELGIIVKDTLTGSEWHYRRDKHLHDV